MQDIPEYQVVEICEQPIPLCQLLKVANLVGGGGEAKIVISEGYVFVNNEVEYQKRKKVYENDIVEFNGEVFQVVVNANSKVETVKPIKIAAAPSKKPTKQKSKKNGNKAQPSTSNNAHEISPTPSTAGRRRPISF